MRRVQEVLEHSFREFNAIEIPRILITIGSYAQRMRKPDVAVQERLQKKEITVQERNKYPSNADCIDDSNVLVLLLTNSFLLFKHRRQYR